jgi:predicted Rossmann-fold nucleotide-binding protein
VEEFFEMYTCAQLGYHSKPCGILNVSGYYDYLLKFLDHAVSQEFLKQTYRDMIIVDQSPQTLINRFMQYQAPLDKKWISHNTQPQLQSC